MCRLDHRVGEQRRARRSPAGRRCGSATATSRGAANESIRSMTILRRCRNAVDMPLKTNTTSMTSTEIVGAADRAVEQVAQEHVRQRHAHHDDERDRRQPKLREAQPFRAARRSDCVHRPARRCGPELIPPMQTATARADARRAARRRGTRHGAITWYRPRRIRAPACRLFPSASMRLVDDRLRQLPSSWRRRRRTA